MMDMEEMARDLIDGTGWDILDEVSIECPCGNILEWDARCSECGPNPLMKMGMI